MYIDLVTINLCPGQGGGGVKPSGTLEISENGVFDVYSYASANVNVQTGGFNEREVTEGVFDIVNLNNSASYVKEYIFKTNSYVQTVNLPNCYKVEWMAFTDCVNLMTVNLPMCISISSSAFRGCSSLSQVNLPMVKTIGQMAFNYCSALSSLTLCTDVYWTIPFGGGRTFVGTPIVTESSSASIYVRSDTYSLWISSQFWSDYSSKFVSVPVSGPALSFSNGLLSGTTKAIASNFTNYLSVSKSDITGVSLPECRYINDQTFQSCSLTQVSLPKCEYINEFAFNDCGSFYQINLPECRYIGDDAFQNCELDQVSLPKCEYLGKGAFRNCWMESITIGYSSVCNMNVDTFNGTDIERGTGSIYVPASLVEAYKSAPNWSQFSSQIFPISE